MIKLNKMNVNIIIIYLKLNIILNVHQFLKDMDVIFIIVILKHVHIVNKIKFIIVEKVNVVIQELIQLQIKMYNYHVKENKQIIKIVKNGHMIQMQLHINVVNVMKIII